MTVSGPDRRSLASRFWEKVDIQELEPSSCWIWTAACDSRGYGCIGSGGKRGITLRSSRVAYELHNGPIPIDGPGTHGWCVRHTCDTPSCVNPAHLVLGSNRENMNDRVMRQTGPRGSSHYASHIDESDVRDIRSSSDTVRTLSARYGMSVSSISEIRNRKTWRHIK